MITSQAIAHLRLSLVPRVGVNTARLLLEAFGSVEHILEQPPSSWSAVDGVGPKLVEALKQALTSEHEKMVQSLVAECENAQIHVICPEDEFWPRNLFGCSDAPLILFVQGKLKALQSEKNVGMVGARRASPEGKLIARRWSSYLSEQGACMISGMAPGIDSAVHGGSLDASCAGIAVLGYGLLAGNGQQKMQIDAMTREGCVISEYAPRTVAKAGYFPQRNRLIAGISDALVVVEGGLKSGSLITAGRALHYGREIFAVPGSVLNDIHAGCHQLIKDGAILVSDASEILQHMRWNLRSDKALRYVPASEEEAKVLTCIGHQVMHIDALAEDCGLTVSALSTILLRLELQGAIEKLSGNRYTLS